MRIAPAFTEANFGFAQAGYAQSEKGEIMLKNYFKIAIRNILKNKVYSFINIIGLAVGMAVCILIALYVINDRFHKNADRIVRATMMYSFNGVKDETAYTGTELLPAFKRNFPEVENGVRMYNTKAIVKYKNEVFNEPNFAYADSTFFKVFSFKLLHGDPKQALVRPYSVILTAAAARKYFGDENPIDKVIKVNMRILLTNPRWERKRKN
jgi:putative ABC transport system permease protein